MDISVEVYSLDTDIRLNETSGFLKIVSEIKTYILSFFGKFYDFNI